MIRTVLRIAWEDPCEREELIKQMEEQAGVEKSTSDYCSFSLERKTEMDEVQQGDGFLVFVRSLRRTRGTC